MSDARIDADRTARVELGRKIAAGGDLRGDFSYSVIEVPAAPRPGVGDRRVLRRVRTRLHEGTVSEHGSRVAVVGCRIRDQSSRGARLELESARLLPRAFVLTDATLRKRFWVTLVWQAGLQAGVRIVPLKA